MSFFEKISMNSCTLVERCSPDQESPATSSFKKKAVKKSFLQENKLIIQALTGVAVALSLAVIVVRVSIILSRYQKTAFSNRLEILFRKEWRTLAISTGIGAIAGTVLGTSAFLFKKEEEEGLSSHIQTPEEYEKELEQFLHCHVEGFEENEGLNQGWNEWRSSKDKKTLREFCQRVQEDLQEKDAQARLGYLESRFSSVKEAHDQAFKAMDPSDRLKLAHEQELSALNSLAIKARLLNVEADQYKISDFEKGLFTQKAGRLEEVLKAFWTIAQAREEEFEQHFEKVDDWGNIEYGKIISKWLQKTDHSIGSIRETKQFLYSCYEDAFLDIGLTFEDRLLFTEYLSIWDLAFEHKQKDFYKQQISADDQTKHNDRLKQSLEEMQSSLKERIGGFEKKDLSTELKEYQEEDFAFDDQEKIDLFFKKTRALIKQIHKIEQKLLKKKDLSDIEEKVCLRTTLKIQDKWFIPSRSILKVLDFPSEEERLQKRKDQFLKKIVHLLLEQTSEGQQLLPLLLLDPKLSKENKSLYRLSIEQMQVFENKIKPCAYALIEQLERFSSLRDPIKAYQKDRIKASLKEISDNSLRTMKSQIKQWNKQVIEVWVKHLTAVQKKEIQSYPWFQTTKKAEQLRTYFSKWLYGKTNRYPQGIPLKLFEKITFSDDPKEAAVIKPLRKRGALDFPLIAKRREEVEDNDLVDPSRKIFSGFPAEEIKPEVPFTNPELKETLPGIQLNFKPGIRGDEVEYSSFIDLLKKVPGYRTPDGQEGSVDQAIDWILDCINTQDHLYQTSFKEGVFILEAAFFDLIENHLENVLNSPKHLPFKQKYVEKVLVPSLEKGNAVRSRALKGYLDLILLPLGSPLNVTVDQQRGLQQLCALAQVPIPMFQLQIVDDLLNSSLQENSFDQIVEAIRSNPSIALEGLDDQIVQQTAHSLEKASLTRLRLDGWRARGDQLNSALVIHFRDYLLENVEKSVEEESDSDSDFEKDGNIPVFDQIQRQQRYAEHFFKHCFSLRSEQEQQKFIAPIAVDLHTFFDKIEALDKFQIARESLSLPRQVSLAEALCKYDQNDQYQMRERLKMFNQKLIQAKSDTLSLFIGLARDLTEKARVLKKEQSLDSIVRFIQACMAYQYVKKECFDDKIALHKGLKVAVAEASQALASSAEIIRAHKQILKEGNIEEIFNKLTYKKEDEQNLDPWEGYVNSVVKFLSEDKTQVQEVDDHLFLNFENQMSVHLLSGALYVHGDNPVELPEAYRYHPHLNLTGLDSLPYFLYVEGQETKYVHYTYTEKGLKIPSITLFFKDREFVIERFMSTTDGDKQLQFLPPEKFMDEIPASVSQRMGIKEFWFDANGNIYGLDEEGIEKAKLIRKTGFNQPTFRVCIKGVNYHFKSKSQDPFIKSVYQKIITAVGNEEVLVAEDATMIYVPGLDLRFNLDPVKQQVACEGPNIAGMFLDLEKTEKGVLVLKWAEPKDFKTQQKKLKDELQKVENQKQSFLKNAQLTDDARKELNEIKEKIEQYNIEKRKQNLLKKIKELTKNRDVKKAQGFDVSQEESELGQAEEELESLEDFIKDESKMKLAQEQFNRLIKQRDQILSKAGLSLEKKARFAELESQIAHLKAQNAALNKRLYVRVLDPKLEKQQGLFHTTFKEVYVDAIDEMKDAAEFNKDDLFNTDPVRRYTKAKENFLRLKTKYDQEFTRPTQHFLLETADEEECLSARTFLGSLHLVKLHLEKPTESSISDKEMISEIGKHKFTSPLDPDTFKVVETLSEYVDELSEHPELALYLALLSCHQHFLILQESQKKASTDSVEKRALLKNNYQKAKDWAEKAFDNCDQRSFHSQIQKLMCVHLQDKITLSFPEKDNVYNATFTSFKPASQETITQEVSKSLIERLGLEKEIKFRRKNASKDLTQQQKKLIDQFKSKDQVAGFRLEEFGLFSQGVIYTLFESSKPKEYLFGLDENMIQGLIGKLTTEKGWIRTESTTGDLLSYVATSLGENPLLHVKDRDWHALVSDLPISQKHKERVIKRLQTFFFQACSSGYIFSWNDPTKPSSKVQEALSQEVKKIEQTMLEAKDVLDETLERLGLTITELQRKVLFDDSSVDPEKLVESPRFSAQQSHKEMDRARKALIRYLLYKTELDHLKNAMKAPLTGERNQVELLSIPRQYSINFLLDLPTNPEEEEERRLQLAFLMFEASYQARCNPAQEKFFRALMLPEDHPEARDASQARMGFGKTALFPLISMIKLAREASVAPEKKSLVRYVVPKAVLQDNASSFHAMLSSVLGSHVIQDFDFPRCQIDEDNKTYSLRSALDVIEQRIQFYTFAKEKGIVLIQYPEIRQSIEAQEHSFGKYALNPALSENERSLVLMCKQRLAYLRSMKTFTIYDELDATQDIKSSEVNFTEGKKDSIDPDRVKLLNGLIDVVHAKQTVDPSELVAPMLEACGFDFAGNDERRHSLFSFLTTSSYEPKTFLKLYIGSLNDEHKKALYLIRGILTDPNMLSFVFNKQPGTHFGPRITVQGGQKSYSFDPRSKSRLLIAVPYDGVNTPKGLSTFDNTEVAAITTMRYYESFSTTFDLEYVDFLVRQMQEGKISSRLQSILQNQDEFMRGLREIIGTYDPKVKEEKKKAFFENFLKEPAPSVRKFFGQLVVSVQVCSDEFKANSNRYEMGTREDRRIGCSGTVGGTSSYFVREMTDPAADGKLSLEIMGRHNNQQVVVLPEIKDDAQDPLNDVLEALIQPSIGQQTRAIIDAAGICKSRDGKPSTVVAELWKILKKHGFSSIEGIVFYDAENHKQLYRGPEHVIIPCTTAMEIAALKGEKYFSFYGQKNTRGSDIKQANGSHAIVTMDENVTNSDAKQAVLRFRNLVNRSSRQTFSFAVTPRYKKLVQEKPTKKKEEITAADIALYLRFVEKEKEEKDAVMIFIKEMGAHIQQAAVQFDHLFCDIENFDKQAQGIYLRFLEARNAIVPMVQCTIQELGAKYGSILTEKDKADFIDELRQKRKGELKDLADLAQKTLDSLKDALFYTEDQVEKKRTEIPLIEQFFVDRFDQSERVFNTRYSKSKVQVKDPSDDVGAEAIAMALAQAEAQAQAEAIAEALAEVQIEAVEDLRVERINIIPFKDFQISEDWFDNPIGTPLSDQDIYFDMLHERIRDRISLSPHLSDASCKTLVTHFILYNQANQEGILISEQEASKWLEIKGARDSNWRVLDLRDGLPEIGAIDEDASTAGMFQDPDTAVSSNLIAHLREAFLLYRGFDAARLEDLKTEKLKEGSLLPVVNATQEQLLPYLEVNDDQTLDLTSFGVSLNFNQTPQKVSCTLEKESDEFSFQVGDKKMTLPLDNSWLKDAFEHVYKTKQSEIREDKFQAVKKYHIQKSLGLRSEIEELKKKQAELEELKQRLQGLVANASALTVSHDLRKGCEDRDDYFAGTKPGGYQHWLDWGRLCDGKFSTLGKDFLRQMKAIQDLQKAFSDAPTKNNLDSLTDKINAFISQPIRDHFKKSVITEEEIKGLIKEEEIKGLTEQRIEDLKKERLKALKKEKLRELAKVKIGDIENLWNDTLKPNQWTRDPDVLEKIKKIPTFDSMYIRILYMVHGGKFAPKGAADCGQPDCRELFNEFLPALSETLQGIAKAAQELPELWKQEKKLEAQIKELEKKEACLKIADEALESMESFSSDVVKEFKGKAGVLLTPAGKDQEHFWDRIQDSDWFLKTEASKKTVVVEVLGKKPSYLSTVCLKTSEFKGRLICLSARERFYDRLHSQFIQRIQELAKNVEDRHKELIVSP